MFVRTLIAAATVAALLGGTFAGSPSRADAAATAADTIEIADATHSDSERDAREIAGVHGHEVVVDSQSGPNLLVVARPDGTMQARSSQVPEQAQVAGEWKSIDTTLVKEDGWLVPKVAAVPIRIAGGGSSDIVQVRGDDGAWITESWPYGDLPVPRLKKSTAVFEEVFPGVDLQVKATKAGMREVLVVKTAEAAEDERLGQLKFAIKGAKLVTQPETGTLSAVQRDDAQLVASTPLWWDSSEKAADADGPGGGEAQAVAVEQTSDSESVLDVDAITKTGVTYPLYVDPDWSAYLQYDWYTDRAYPTQSYLNPPENSVGYGIKNGVHFLSRAFYRFDTAFLKGKTVQDARFQVLQTYANSCDQTLVQLWQYGASGVGFTWNGDPNLWARALDAQGNAKGGPCDPNPGWVGFSATVAAQEATVLPENFLTLALRSANEGNSLTRKHYRWDAQLIVTYNSKPDVPTDLAMLSPNRPCSTDPADPVYLNNKAQRTLMRVRASDPDRTNVTANVYLRRESTGVVTTLLGTMYLAAGSELMHEAPAGSLVDGELYSWVSRASDGAALSELSPRCYFVNDTSRPALPTIEVVSGAGRVGEPMTVKVTTEPGDRVAGFQVWWTQGARPTSPAEPAATSYTSSVPPCESAAGAGRIVCADAEGSATFEVAPIGTKSTLWVASYDRAGNVSGAPILSVGQEAAAEGLEVTATNADLRGGHAWMPFETDLASIDDAIGSLPLVIGANTGWAAPGVEDAAVGYSSLRTVTQFTKPYYGHVATVEGVNSAPGGSTVESELGALLTYTPGQPQPANTWLVYQCAFGDGNALSLAANCEGNGAAGKPVGYSWKSKPSGYATAEVFRCHSYNDYFASRQADCISTRYTTDYSLGFFVQGSPLPTTTSVFAGDAALGGFGTTPLKQYVKPYLGHFGVIGGYNSFPDGAAVESELGRLIRYIPGVAQPANTTLIYECGFGDGNALSASSTCEGKANGVPVGYTWRTKPAGYDTGELYRCHSFDDYFASLRSDCIRYTTDGSLGYVLLAEPEAAPVDTTKSYAVSVRAKATSAKGVGTAASNSAFSVQTVDGVWRFCVTSSTADLPPACVSGPAVDSGRFVTVTGIRDAINRRLTIVVNDGRTSRSEVAAYAAVDSPRSADPLVIGSTPAGRDWFDGFVADAAIHQAVPSLSQLNRTPVPQP